jgi:hypothetical protein
MLQLKHRQLQLSVSAHHSESGLASILEKSYFVNEDIDYKSKGGFQLPT